MELDWDHRDPADRVIVATASLREARQATSDSATRKFYRGLHR
jgi:PIN domain nuclease of toxin-antitoxin system